MKSIKHLFYLNIIIFGINDISNIKNTYIKYLFTLSICIFTYKIITRKTKPLSSLENIDNYNSLENIDNYNSLDKNNYFLFFFVIFVFIIISNILYKYVNYKYKNILITNEENPKNDKNISKISSQKNEENTNVSDTSKKISLDKTDHQKNDKNISKISSQNNEENNHTISYQNINYTIYSIIIILIIMFCAFHIIFCAFHIIFCAFQNNNEDQKPKKKTEDNKTDNQEIDKFLKYLIKNYDVCDPTIIDIENNEQALCFNIQNIDEKNLKLFNNEEEPEDINPSLTLKKNQNKICEFNLSSLKDFRQSKDKYYINGYKEIDYYIIPPIYDKNRKINVKEEYPLLIIKEILNRIKIQTDPKHSKQKIDNIVETSMGKYKIETTNETKKNYQFEEKDNKSFYELVKKIISCKSYNALSSEYTKLSEDIKNKIKYHEYDYIPDKYLLVIKLPSSYKNYLQNITKHIDNDGKNDILIGKNNCQIIATIDCLKYFLKEYKKIFNNDDFEKKIIEMYNILQFIFSKIENEKEIFWNLLHYFFTINEHKPNNQCEDKVEINENFKKYLNQAEHKWDIYTIYKEYNDNNNNNKFIMTLYNYNFMEDSVFHKNKKENPNINEIIEYISASMIILVKKDIDKEQNIDGIDNFFKIFGNFYSSDKVVSVSSMKFEKNENIYNLLMKYLETLINFKKKILSMNIIHDDNHYYVKYLENENNKNEDTTNTSKKSNSSLNKESQINFRKIIHSNEFIKKYQNQKNQKELKKKVNDYIWDFKKLIQTENDNEIFPQNINKKQFIWNLFFYYQDNEE
ncbi:hypothetical protein AB836_00210 [Rickettsiales bacterium (ex Bugula neritina AB1)]|nr:hypothetical protein AB836_00210 [Rickettsiales bacterium (ex Bugula neritina AB1)]